MKKICSTLLALACLTGCGPHTGIIIGSKNFTEQIILGEIAAQQIERKLKIPVQRKFDLGGTLLIHEALIKNQIDIYPEYTGTAASSVLKQKISSDPAAAYSQVKAEYLRRFQAVWLPPLGFNDTFAMVVRQVDGKRLGQGTLSEAKGRSWRLGVGYEFLTRSDGLQSLNNTYRLQWQNTPKTMDLGLLYKALETDQIDMAAANSTDGTLQSGKFTALVDDKKAFPPYSACFVIRKSVADEHENVTAALSLLSNQISEEMMQKLNREVDIGHRPVVRVVQEFLATKP